MMEQMSLFPSVLSSPYASDYRRRGGWRRPRPRPENRGHHENSLASHASMRDHLGRRAEAVLGWVREHGPATDRMIRDGLFGPAADMNAVRPRVSELLESGRLAECGRTVDPFTGRMVRRVRAANP